MARFEALLQFPTKFSRSHAALSGQVKFVESHAGVSDATAAFVRFAIAAAAMLPFADWRETEVLLAGESRWFC